MEMLYCDCRILILSFERLLSYTVKLHHVLLYNISDVLYVTFRERQGAGEESGNSTLSIEPHSDKQIHTPRHH